MRFALSLIALACVRHVPEASPGPEAAIRGVVKGKMRVEAPNQAASAPITIVLDRPDRSSLAVLGPLGGPLWTMTTVGSTLSVLDVRGRQQHLAIDAGQVLGDVLGVDAPTLWGILVGDPVVLPPEGLPGPVPGTRLSDLPLVSGRSLRILAEVPSGRPVHILALDVSGTPRASVHYGPFVAYGNVALPSTVDVEVHELNLTVRLEFTGFNDTDPLPDVFSLVPPPGFTTSPLTDLGAVIPR